MDFEAYVYKTVLLNPEFCAYTVEMCSQREGKKEFGLAITALMDAAAHKLVLGWLSACKGAVHTPIAGDGLEAWIAEGQYFKDKCFVHNEGIHTVVRLIGIMRTHL